MAYLTELKDSTLGQELAAYIASLQGEMMTLQLCQQIRHRIYTILPLDVTVRVVPEYAGQSGTIIGISVHLQLGRAYLRMTLD